MPSVLSNFVALRKNRGDILDPVTRRTALEMIQGILNRYNFDEFNNSYESFVNHLLDYDDPHHVTDTSFFNDVIEATYAIYVKMTNSPLDEVSFRSEIVNSARFLELIRRIVLNRYLYNLVKNPDGSVPQSATVILNRDWPFFSVDYAPVTITFGSGIVDEDAFIALGIGANTGPAPIIFNADGLMVEYASVAPMVHISPQTPWFSSILSPGEYFVDLHLSSNDFVMTMEVDNTPAVKTAIASLLNGTDTFTVSVNPDRSVDLELNGTPLSPSRPCSQGAFQIEFSRDGTIELITWNNGSFVTTTVSVSPLDVFLSGRVSLPVTPQFSTTFGFRKLTIGRYL